MQWRKEGSITAIKLGFSFIVMAWFSLKMKKFRKMTFSSSIKAILSVYIRKITEFTSTNFMMTSLLMDFTLT